VLVIELKEFFGFSVRQVSYVFFVVPAILGLCSLWLVPRAVARLGHGRTIGIGVVIMLPTCALLASPLARLSVWVSLVLFQLAIVGLSFQQNANQAVARLIGEKYTHNGTGAVVGAGRTCWAAGQAVSPAVSLAMYESLGYWAPWALFGLLQLVVVLMYAALRVPLWTAGESSPAAAKTAAGDHGVESISATPGSAPEVAA
jgi:MFS family permease